MLGSLVSKRSLAAVGAALCLTGCPDPDARYDEYETRSADERGRSSTPPEGYFGEAIATDNVAKAEVAGRFMLAVATQLDPGSPLLFQADVVVVDASDPWTIDMELRPLRALCEGGAKCTPTDAGYREVLEDAVINTPGPVPYVDADSGDENLGTVGLFDIAFGEVTVPGEANAVSGSEILVNLNLYGATRADTVCGEVDGGLVMPFAFALERDKNTFGTVRLADGGSYGDLAPVRACP